MIWTLILQMSNKKGERKTNLKVSQNLPERRDRNQQVRDQKEAYPEILKTQD